MKAKKNYVNEINGEIERERENSGEKERCIQKKCGRIGEKMVMKETMAAAAISFILSRARCGDNDMSSRSRRRHKPAAHQWVAAMLTQHSII